MSDKAKPNIIAPNQNVPKFYKINNERYINPAYLHKKVSSRVIDNWPAHSSGRLYPHSQILVTNNHNIRLLNEHESKLPNLVPKPKFLEFLEDHVKQELMRNKVNDIKPCRIRLQVYGDVFEWLIQALKSYRPLLASIKREYEMNIDFLRSELTKVEPMKELLWTLSQEYDQRLMAIRNKESHEITSLKQDKTRVNTEVSNLKSEKDTLKCEVTRLIEELESQNTICRTEADARKLLITDINDLRSKLKEMERLAMTPMDGVEKEDPVKIRWAYEQAKIALVESNRKLVHIQATYADVVPKKQHDDLIEIHMTNMEQCNLIKEEKISLYDALNALQSQYNAIYIQRDHLYMQLKNARQKIITNTSISKAERTVLEKNDQKIQQMRDNIDDEVDKWVQLAKELPHDDLVKRIQEELAKTDGSAEVALEVFMNPALQEILGSTSAIVHSESHSTDFGQTSPGQ